MRHIKQILSEKWEMLNPETSSFASFFRFTSLLYAHPPSLPIHFIQMPTPSSCSPSMVTVQNRRVLARGPSMVSCNDPGSRALDRGSLGAAPFPPPGAQWPWEVNEWVETGSYHMTYALLALGAMEAGWIDFPVSCQWDVLFSMVLLNTPKRGSSLARGWWC